MSELPNSWAVVRIGECFLEIRNGTTATQNQNGRGVPVSRIETIQKSKFDLKRIGYIENPSDELIETYRYKRGDIALSHINSYEHVGKTALYQGTPSLLIHGMNLLRLRLGQDEIAPAYAHYFMLSNFFRDEVRQRVGHAVNQVSINQKKLSEVPFMVAPLNEQRRIVAKLEKLLSRVDAVQGRLATIPCILKRFRQSVLAAACSGQLTIDWRESDPHIEPAAALLAQIAERRALWLEQQSRANNSEAKRLERKLKHQCVQSSVDNGLPKSWIWSSLLHSCWLIVDCHNKTAPYTSFGVPLIRTTNIKGGRLVLKELKYVSKETYDYWSRRCPPQANDILFTREAPMGECAIIPAGFKICMGQRLMLFRVFEDLFDVKYLCYALQEPLFQSRLEDNSVGSGVKHLRVGDVESLIVPVPPLPEQQEIVRRVEALFKTADALEARYLKAKAHVDKLTQSILAKAFRGELVPQDPNDEPACVLLEHISQSRVTNREKKKTRNSSSATKGSAPSRSKE